MSGGTCLARGSESQPPMAICWRLVSDKSGIKSIKWKRWQIVTKNQIHRWRVGSTIYVVERRDRNDGVRGPAIFPCIHGTSYLNLIRSRAGSAHDLKRCPLDRSRVPRSPQIDYLERGDSPRKSACHTAQRLRVLPNITGVVVEGSVIQYCRLVWKVQIGAERSEF